MDPWQAWLVVVAMAVGTFAIRWSVIGALHQHTFSPWVERALTLVLPAMFSAIAIPMLLFTDGRVDLAQSAPKIIAALVTLWSAMRWRGYLLPLVLGMLVMHLLQWLLRLSQAV
ncbi:MAG: AzlD domain-containing protein [Casimicrobiaceae bacterium]